MSAWPSPRESLSSWRRGASTAPRLDVLLVAFLAATLLVRVLTDDTSAPDSQNSGGINLSGAIAVLFIIVAAGLLLRRRRGILGTVLIGLWLCVWTAAAVSTDGASTETIREGVREASVIALGVIVYNARGAVTVSLATRLIQLLGFAPALLAVYQLVAHTGSDIAGELRSYGTFAHPDSAAMFFAIAAIISLWRYLDDGRRGVDVLLTLLFAAALLATFSLDGLITLVAMLLAYGALRPGSLGAKLVPCAIAGLLVLTFFATPLGAKRLSNESTTSIRTAEHGESNSSLAWRLNKWKLVLPEWEESPLAGRGLGTTVTGARMPGDQFAGEAPHNEFVRYLVETGVIGLTILLCALGLLIGRLIRMRRAPAAGDRPMSKPATLAIVIVIGCLVNSLAEDTLLNSPTCYAVVLILAAVLSLPTRATRQAPVAQAA
jgi:O-antigen ligase